MSIVESSICPCDVCVWMTVWEYSSGLKGKQGEEGEGGKGEGGGKYEDEAVQRFNPGLKLRVKHSIKVLK